MEVISNTGLGDNNTSAIDCVWFSTLKLSDYNNEHDFINAIVDGYNAEGSLKNVFIKYSIDWTDSSKYPKLIGLMEYNKIPNISYPVNFSTSDILTFNSESHYIGEYFTSETIITSKVIFPKVLISKGYITAIIFQEDPVSISKDALPWKYIVSLDESGIDIETNNIIQFSNDSNELEEDFVDIHTSNYSNPHSDQISRISTDSETSNITSFAKFNSLITSSNSIVIKSYLVTEDFSVRYLGDKLDSSEFEDVWGR